MPVDNFHANIAVGEDAAQIPPVEQAPERQQISPDAEQIETSSLQLRTEKKAGFEVALPFVTMTFPEIAVGTVVFRFDDVRPTDKTVAGILALKEPAKCTVLPETKRSPMIETGVPIGPATG